MSLALGGLLPDRSFVFSLSRNEQHRQGASHPCGGGPSPNGVIRKSWVVARMALNKFVSTFTSATNPEMSSTRPAWNGTVLLLWGKRILTGRPVCWAACTRPGPLAVVTSMDRVGSGVA